MAAERYPNEMLEELRRMRRVPGIIFADDVGGRVPKIAGTGLEVFEIITTFEAVDRSWNRLAAAFHWLTADQLRAALAYADAYPDDIQARINEERATLARLGWSDHSPTR